MWFWFIVFWCLVSQIMLCIVDRNQVLLNPLLLLWSYSWYLWFGRYFIVNVSCFSFGIIADVLHYMLSTVLCSVIVRFDVATCVAIVKRSSRCRLILRLSLVLNCYDSSPKFSIFLHIQSFIDSKISKMPQHVKLMT